MANIKVEISIKDNETGEYILVPQLPPTIQYQEGDAKSRSVEIIDLGDVEFPAGRGLDSFGWSSDFPARYDPGYVTTSDLKQPQEYRDLFRRWKNNETSLQLICPAAGINTTMYLASFNWEYKGFEGDLGYNCEFRELRTIRPKKLTPNGTAPPKGKKQPEDRPALPKKEKPDTYTVKSGDYLIKIAKKLGISDWRNDLYEPNKGVIGPDPGDIYPGQELKI